MQADTKNDTDNPVACLDTARDRQYVLDRVVESLTAKYLSDLDLLYPEMVAALCKCDVRTLESKGLRRVEIGPRNIRYRRCDVEDLIRRGMNSH